MSQSKDNFAKFGTHFQTKVLQSLLLDVKFFERIFDILNISYFDSKVHNTIYEKIQKYFDKYKIPPTIADVEILVLQEENELIRQQAHELIQTIKKAQVNDVQFIKDEAIKFCRNQKMKAALYKSIDLWEGGKYDEIWKVVGDALKAGEESNVGHDYWNDLALEHRISLMKRSPIPTGLTHLDEILNGGLSKGELGVVVAGTGLGKTWLMCAIAKAAIVKNLKVAHYTLELYEHQVGLRYDTILTGIPQENIPNMPDVVKRKLKQYNLKDNLIIKHYPTKRATTNTVRLHLDRLHQQGMIPDVLIIDYADLMKPLQKYEQRRFELEGIYEELRGLAGELAIPIWTASQSNRSSMDSEVVSLSLISESFAKAAVADVIITLSRTVEDKLKNAGRLFVAKNRAGKDGVIIPLTMDLTNYKIETQKPIDNLDDLKKDLNSLDLGGHNKKMWDKFNEQNGK